MAAFVHVGQCGNQLGAAFWELVSDGDGGSDLDTAEATAKQQQRSLRRRPPPPSTGSKHSLSDQLARHFFLRQSHKARCVLVDTEPKVVASVVASGLQPAYSHVEQSGRGNNWAMGYNLQRYQRNILPTRASSHSTLLTGHPGDDNRRELVELAMDSLQKLVEATDCFQGTVLLHSLGGGTGSGLGSRLMERIRDAYPRSYLVAVSVAPSWKCGDTPLQNYNAVFTLAHLQEHADCIVYKENDELLRAVSYWKALQAAPQDTNPHAGDVSSGPMGTSQQRISIAELNHLAAADLAGLFFPTASYSSVRSTPVVQPFDFGKLVHDLSPLPAAKIIDVRTGVLRAKQRPTTAATSMGAGTSSTDALFHAGTCNIPLATHSGRNPSNDGEVEAIASKLFRQTVQSFPRSASSSPTLACSALIRGFSFANESAVTRSFQAAADAVFPGVAWNPEHQAVVSTSSLPPFEHIGGRASVTICTNNGHVLTSAEQFLQRAQRQFRANAYVHWYKQHGLEESHFHEAFEKCERLKAGYKELLS